MRAELVERSRQAAPASLASESARHETLAFCNATLRDLDSLREPRYSPDLSILFPRTPEEQELYQALLVRSWDNDTAREVKNEYRALLNGVKKDAALARKLVAKLGPGTHTLSNGDVVVISRDRSGNVRVRTTRSDGSSQEVSYNEKSPQDVRVEERSAEGRSTVTERHGQTVSKTEGRVETSYSLDDQGCPVRERRGPGHDDFVKTTVNKDGSTDTRELLYYQDEVEEGEDAGVYEDTHEPGRGPKKHKDAGAGRAIERLEARNPKVITAEMLRGLVVQATADLDNQAAGREYQDLKKYVTENWTKLDEEAKQVWQIYERYVYDAQAAGQTGIRMQDYEEMKKEMAEVSGPSDRPHRYRDAGAGEAIEEFRRLNPEEITPEMLARLIQDATRDFDNQAAGTEYQDLKDFLAEVSDRLTPEARQVWEIYEKYVQAAQAKGQTGIEDSEHRKMLREMGEVSESEYQDESAARAIEDLEAQNPSRIDERLLVDLILRATVDADNQSAGAEYDDLKKYVTENWAKLTPEAKDKWQVYERFVYDARAKGETGLTGIQFLRMMGELFG